MTHRHALAIPSWLSSRALCALVLASLSASACHEPRTENIRSADHPALRDAGETTSTAQEASIDGPPGEDEPEAELDAAAPPPAELAQPVLDAALGAAPVPGVDATLPEPQDAAPVLFESHFHIVFREVDLNVDCEMLDVDVSDPAQGLAGYSYLQIGGFSRSTNQAFKVNAPLSAARLRDPSILGGYPILAWSSFTTANTPAAILELSLRLVDSKGGYWVSCGPGSCDLPTPDPAHQHTITEIEEQLASTPGVASFRIRGSYQARVRALDGSGELAEAHGDWSLLVTVPDPGPLACFRGCEDSASGTCVEGRAESACGKAGALCIDCQEAGLVCLEGACRTCRPGATTTASCAGGCGLAPVVCDADGMWGPAGACTLTRPPCGSSCCAADQVCMQCEPPGPATVCSAGPLPFFMCTKI